MPGKPGYRLMPECVRSRLHAGSLGVALDDLLDPLRCEGTGEAGLKEIAVLGMGREVGAQGRGEGLPEQDNPIFGTLPLVNSDSTGVQVNVRDFDLAQLRDPHAGIEKQSEHKRVLRVSGAIDFLIEASKLLGRQDIRKFAPLPGRLEPAYLPDFLSDVSPPFVVQPVLADQSGDAPDQKAFDGFRT